MNRCRMEKQSITAIWIKLSMWIISDMDSLFLREYLAKKQEIGARLTVLWDTAFVMILRIA
jgi:hypothetical protein